MASPWASLSFTYKPSPPCDPLARLGIHLLGLCDVDGDPLLHGAAEHPEVVRRAGQAHFARNALAKSLWIVSRLREQTLALNGTVIHQRIVLPPPTAGTI